MARGTRERYACHFKNRGTNSYNYNVTLTLDNQKYNNIFTLIVFIKNHECVYYTFNMLLTLEGCHQQFSHQNEFQTGKERTLQ